MRTHFSIECMRCTQADETYAGLFDKYAILIRSCCPRRRRSALLLLAFYAKHLQNDEYELISLKVRLENLFFTTSVWKAFMQNKALENG